MAISLPGDFSSELFEQLLHLLDHPKLKIVVLKKLDEYNVCVEMAWILVDVTRPIQPNFQSYLIGIWAQLIETLVNLKPKPSSFSAQFLHMVGGGYEHLSQMFHHMAGESPIVWPIALGGFLTNLGRLKKKYLQKNKKNDNLKNSARIITLCAT